MLSRMQSNVIPYAPWLSVPPWCYPVQPLALSRTTLCVIPYTNECYPVRNWVLSRTISRVIPQHFFVIPKPFYWLSRILLGVIPNNHICYPVYFWSLSRTTHSVIPTKCRYPAPDLCYPVRHLLLSRTRLNVIPHTIKCYPVSIGCYPVYYVVIPTWKPCYSDHYSAEKMLSRTNMALSRHFFHVIPYNYYVIPTLYRPENVTKLSRRFVIPMLFRWQFLLFRKKKWLYRTLYRSCYKGGGPF